MTPPAPGQGGLDEGAARILVVVDAAVPLAVHEACADLAARLADRAGLRQQRLIEGAALSLPL